MADGMGWAATGVEVYFKGKKTGNTKLSDVGEL
jgi:hypothetical protein